MTQTQPASYEIVFLVRPDVSTEQVKNITKRFETLVGTQNGTIIKTEDWGLRTLSYIMRKHQKAYYTMIGANMPGTAVSEIERQMNISDDIIRFQIVRVDSISTEPSVMLKGRRDDDETEFQS